MTKNKTRFERPLPGISGNKPERHPAPRHCRDTLGKLSRPFFIPEKLGIDLAEFQNTAEKYALNVKFKNKNYWCLRREFPGEVLVEQLGEISGRYFAPPHAARPPAFLKDHSSGEKESAGILGVAPDILNRLIAGGDLEYFFLDQKIRLWRSDLEELKNNRTRLSKLTREYEKLKTNEAAALLGIPAGRLISLLKEEKLSPMPDYETKGKDYFFKLQDIKKLRENLLAGTSRRNFGREPGGNNSGFPEEKPAPVRRKRPIRKKTRPTENEKLVLDDFQIKAAKALRKGQSVLVAAPTGNGKTLVAEMLAEDLLSSGRGMVYTSPLKALSNQKYRDFQARFGKASAGLVTGDISLNAGAPLLIMTTEIFRNWCFSEPEQLKNIAYVVFDEIHYLDDAERGTTWEESILFAPPHIKILGLSATVPNVEEIAEWINKVRKEKVTVIQENRRNVPLEIRWVLPDGTIARENEARSAVEELTGIIKNLRGKKRWLK